MEKGIELLGRYHYQNGYYVEVTSESIFSGTRDYWLCKRDNSKKLFMFSSDYKNERTEERQILRCIEKNIQIYEQCIPDTLMA